MVSTFSHDYCPHCNAVLDTSIVKFPKRCPVCKGGIAYGRMGTRKPYFEFLELYGFPKIPELPMVIKDIAIFALLVFAIVYTVYHYWR